MKTLKESRSGIAHAVTRFFACKLSLEDILFLALSIVWAGPKEFTWLKALIVMVESVLNLKDRLI